MDRVLVIGPCGAGKSTLSAALGPRLGLPVHHMDQLNWNPGWVESERETLLARLDAVVATDRWLIDGNYGSSLPPRLARADTIVYLDYPIHLCLRRLLRRIWTYRGRSRPDMPPGCPERFDLAFFFYVLTWNSGPRKRTEAVLRDYPGRLIRLPNPGALTRWLATLPPAPTAAPTSPS
ncbi:MAG: topology modulation protein [Sphingopyxis sp.]|uniref:topology modulation protein n=1 Tax=Sphingopyxis sp. TaxID=1908224 RepID=UPI002ABA2B30|nr:topology modulation protein [Sphingopyxis sp.]MDZ3831326.1 topology modulation protein [Sphingopyxis sp.]